MEEKIKKEIRKMKRKIKKEILRKINKKIIRKISKAILKKEQTKKTENEEIELKKEILNEVFMEKTAEFGFILKENNSKKTAEELIKLYFVSGFSFGLLSIGISSVLEFNSVNSIVFFVLCFILPGLLHYFFHLFLFEKNKREKEKNIPDVLLQASIFPKGTSMLKIIKYISESDYFISKEFNKALNEIQKGKSTENALKGISFRCRSEIISRAINLLIQGSKSGAEMNKVFKETAEDILETQSIIKERIASTLIQKYTLILAGGIIVPALLGLITGFINEMNFLGVNELGLGMASAERKEIIEVSFKANQIYILEYAVIASVFIAQQEGNTKKALVYSLILIPLGIVCYNLALLL